MHEKRTSYIYIFSLINVYTIFLELNWVKVFAGVESFVSGTRR